MTPLLRYLYPNLLWSTTSPSVHLTFDDGPHPDSTPRLLELLRKHNVLATFFIIGKNALAHPELVRDIKAQGHVIGNHSFSHSRLLFRNPAFVSEEIRRADDILGAILNEKQIFFRPPYGHLSPSIIKTAHDHNHSIAMWSVDSRDFKSHSSASVAERVRRRANPGSIILFHDNEATKSILMETVSRTIDLLQQNGLGFAALPA